MTTRMFSICLFIFTWWNITVHSSPAKQKVTSPEDAFPPLPLALSGGEKSTLGANKIKILNNFISARNSIHDDSAEIFSQCWPYNVSVRTVPYKSDEGEGLLAVERIGPITSTGAATVLNCQYNAYSKGIMKGHALFAIDAETGSPLGYPPIHVHHMLPIRSRVFIALSSDLQCPDGNDVFGGSGCLFQYYPAGYGSSSERQGKPKPFVISMMVQDVRLEHSPPLEYYIERISMWVQNTEQPPTNAQFFNLGVWGLHEDHANTNIFYLPEKKASVHMTTFYFPTGANIVESFPHMHVSERESDELWLIRGSLAEMVNLDRAKNDYPSWFEPIIPARLYPKHAEPMAMPAEQFIQLFGDDASYYMSNSPNAGHEASTVTSTGTQESLLEYAKDEVYTAVGGFRNRKLMCKFVSTVTEVNGAVIKDAEENGGRSLGPITASSSRASRTGWKKGLYYRRASPIGPECDTYRFEANETFTLVAFNSARPKWDAAGTGLYPQHSTIKASVSVDDEMLWHSFATATKMGNLRS